jgi:hypothetical protein
MMFENEYLDQQNDQSNEEHENGNPVDPMHVPHPLRIRRIGVPLFNVEVLFDLPPDTHKIDFE